MRILFVSNLFPPVTRGGYEQWCDEVAVALCQRGHELTVLTTRAEQPIAADAERPFAVRRLLHPEVEGGMVQTTLHLLRRRQACEDENLANTRAVAAQVRPDAVLIWGMWNIGRAVPREIERLLGKRVAYFLSDYWPSLPSAYVQRLQEPARRVHMQLFKSLVSRYFLPRLEEDEPLRLENPICVSRAVRDILLVSGVNIPHAQVIYGGTALAEQATCDRACSAPLHRGPSLRLLYVGRLEPLKGVHTVVGAMHHLRDVPVTLDIVGGGAPDYISSLAAQAQDLGAAVQFLGAVASDQVAQVMADHDALVFPSEWEEPFARSVLEAMAAGLPVIGTTTGGTGEILVEGQTGLTFAAGDSKALAGQIRRLAQDEALRCRLAASACAVVRRRFTLRRMVDELEAALYAMASEPVQIPIRG